MKDIIPHMEVIKKEIFLSNELILSIGEDSIFFDIETLGLSPKYCSVYLIGCLTITDGNAFITLFFAENSGEERIILENFSNLLKGYRKIITFNGESFDMHFLNERGKLYDIDFKFNEYESIDIYKKIRPFKNILHLNSLSQKSLEEFLGIFREDEYDGGRLIDVYKQFEKTHDLDLKKLLILHNFEDVKGMSDIFPLLYYQCLSNAKYTEIEINADTETEIIFKFKIQHRLPKDVRVLLDNFHVKVTGDIISGVMSTEKRQLRCYMSKPSDYVYLPIEDEIIPKSLAATIPKNRKAKATKENCYVRENGLFFRLPEYKKFKSYYNLSDIILYKEDLTNQNCYIKIDSSDKSELSRLIKSLLKFVFT